MSAQNTMKTSKKFDLMQVFSNLSAGLVTGLITIIISISFAALIFSGDLSGFVSSGIGLILAGAVVAGLVSLFTSSFYGTISVPQDVPTALLAAEIAAVSSVILANQTTNDFFLIVVAMMIFTSLMTSFSLFIMGIFDLGKIVRYLPYPVIAGLLGGAGWLLFKGSFNIIGVPFRLMNIGLLFSDAAWLRWLPMVLFGIFLLFILDRVQHVLALPGMLLGGVVLFYITLFILGMPLEQAVADGWFLGPFSEGSLFQYFTLDAVQSVGWDYAVVDHTSSLGAIVIVSIFSALLQLTNIEFSTEDQIDLKREIVSIGLGNLVAGSMGSTITYPSSNLYALSRRMGSRSRLTSLVSIILIALTLIFGAPLLSMLPRPILGGLILFLGANIMREWLVQSYSKMPFVEYLVVWAILIVLNLFGILEGVGIGLLLAIILMVANYSRIDVIKHALSSKNYRSTVDRDSVFMRALENRGNWMRILELQGYIFFGTANSLLGRVRDIFIEDKKNQLKYLMLSFRHVSGVDASALQSFDTLFQVAGKHGVQIVFVSLSQEVHHLLKTGLKALENDAQWKAFDNLDYGAEWCEDEVIRVYQEAGLAQSTRPAEKRLTVSKDRKDRLSGLMNYLEDRDTAVQEEEKEKTLIERLSAYMEHRTVPADELIIEEGKRVNGLHFIEGGVARVEIRDSAGQAVRLRKMKKGSVVGEISLYSRSVSTANVIAEEPCEVYFLPKRKIRLIEKEDIVLANDLHKFLAELLGYRTASSTDTIRALLD